MQALQAIYNAVLCYGPFVLVGWAAKRYLDGWTASRGKHASEVQACRARTAISRASYWVLGTSRRYRIVDTGQQMRPAGQARPFSLLTITSGPPP